MNFGKFFLRVIQAVDKAAVDFKANAPRSVPPPLTGAQLEADLEQLAAAIPIMQAWLAAHPGALTATDDLLDVLEAEGFAWAGSMRSGVDAAPGALSEAATWLPRIIGLLSALQPATTGIPGGWSGARGHIL